MQIKKIESDKKAYLPLLLLADESEAMIERYLDRGHLYGLFGIDLVGLILVTDEGEGVLEIKNLAIAPAYRRQGYGSQLIDFIKQRYSASYQWLQVGTGDSPLTIPFYLQAGFQRHRTVPDFFLINYPHPIVEAGVQLKDMIYLRQRLGHSKAN